MPISKKGGGGMPISLKEARIREAKVREEWSSQEECAAAREQAAALALTLTLTLTLTQTLTLTLTLNLTLTLTLTLSRRPPSPRGSRRSRPPGWV